MSWRGLPADQGLRLQGGERQEARGERARGPLRRVRSTRTSSTDLRQSREPSLGKPAGAVLFSDISELYDHFRATWEARPAGRITEPLLREHGGLIMDSNGHRGQIHRGCDKGVLRGAGRPGRTMRSTCGSLGRRDDGGLIFSTRAGGRLKKPSSRTASGINYGVATIGNIGPKRRRNTRSSATWWSSPSTWRGSQRSIRAADHHLREPPSERVKDDHALQAPRLVGPKESGGDMKIYTAPASSPRPGKGAWEAHNLGMARVLRAWIRQRGDVLP